MRFKLENEQTWTYKDYVVDSEVNFITNNLMYYVLTPAGDRYYIGKNLSKSIVNVAIDYHIKKRKWNWKLLWAMGEERKVYGN